MISFNVRAIASKRTLYTRTTCITKTSREHGQTINIVIELTGNGKTRKMLSGWMVHPLGLITSATPYLEYVW